MKKLIRTFGWSTPPAVALLVVIMLMTAVNATAKVGDTFTQGILKFTVLTEEGDSGTVNMNIQIPYSNSNYTLNIPENCNKNNIRYKIVSISKKKLVRRMGRVYDIRKLKGHISIPNSVTTIGESAFSGCSGLTGELQIPNSVTTIGEYAFKGCSGLTGELQIPNSVTTIGESAFSGCSGLTGELQIPNSVTSIGESAFSGCSGLTGELQIPNSVTTIGEYAFKGCSGLTSVVIPNSVTSIGQSVFSGCSGLTSVVIPNSVTTIGERAFEGCKGLTALTIGNSVTTIGESAFYGCTDLTSVVIPNSVTTIGERAFEGCKGLTALTIGNSVTTIGESAFYGCTDLTSVVIPNSVTTIGSGVFGLYEAENVRHHIIHIATPSLTTQIESNAFTSIFIEEATLPYYACNDNLGQITISNVFFMGTDIAASGLFKSSYVSGHTYVKPSVYAQFKNDATYKNLHLTDNIPVTFPEGQEYITLCRDFDVDLRHANDNLPLNVKPLKAYIVREADMDKGTVYLDELTYIPSRLKANVEGYKGVDEYVGVVLSGTPGYTYYVQMGEDDYSKGIDGQMTLEKALSLDKSSAYNYDVNLAESSYPHPTLVGAAGDMEVKPTETIDGVTYKNYGLKDGKFVEYESEGVIPYNHAYLHVPVSSASGVKKLFTMQVRSSSPATGISEVENPADSVPARKIAYNLMGMRVGSGYHGIVIVDGKKFLRK